MSKNSEIRELLKDKIATSKKIYIATGYFSYRIFEVFKSEFLSFSESRGKFRLIIGEDSDIESIEFFKNISGLPKEEFLNHLSSRYFSTFSDLSNEALTCVFKMFDENLIEVKVGVSNTGGIFHVKEYFFENDAEKGYMIGSLNFTKSALISNHESINYIEDEDSYKQTLAMFENRWNNAIDSVTTIEINRYIVKRVKEEIESRKVIVEEENNIEIRDYQKEAIEGLLSKGFNGFLEMATGTGKTFTALLGVKKYLATTKKKYFVLIVVPLQHLVSQWEEQIKNAIGKDTAIIPCHSGTNWKKTIGNAIDRSDRENVFCVMVKNSLSQNLDQLYESMKYSNNILIFDEAHNLTKKDFQSLSKKYSMFHSKVGLSATPQNYLDEERTELLFNYFKGFHYKFELKRAIEENFLTKYQYHPMIVDLDLNEEKEYKKLTAEIKNEKNAIKKQRLLDERGEVLSKARNKIKKLIEITNKFDSLEYTLIYCNPGEFLTKSNQTRRYIDQVSIELEEKTKLRLQKAKITCSEKLSERHKIIEDFKSKKIDTILAIKCLDEGYDIPAIKNAFILHSTRNPSEFIQRRGRVLRKFKNKEMAYIYDFVVRVDGEVPEDERVRFREYYKLSDNKRNFKDFKNEYIGDGENDE